VQGLAVFIIKFPFTLLLGYYVRILIFQEKATEPFGEQAEVTVRVNFTNTLEVCQELFPLLRRNVRVVNVSSCEGHLMKIPSKEIRDNFSKYKYTTQNICVCAKPTPLQ